MNRLPLCPVLGILLFTIPLSILIIAERLCTKGMIALDTETPFFQTDDAPSEENLCRIFGLGVTSLYLLISVPVVIAVACATKCFRK
jgi:hypothetical protein